ncbi:MAG: hypothetical protein H6907_03445 [Hyphomicrobiales bacterium]|nr:hypothetical protein [Hyphomicrobiales bacterium]
MKKILDLCPKVHHANPTDGPRGVVRVRDLVDRAGRELGPERQRDLLEALLAHLPRDRQKTLLGTNPPADRPLGVALPAAVARRESEAGSAPAAPAPRPQGPSAGADQPAATPPVTNPGGKGTGTGPSPAEAQAGPKDAAKDAPKDAAEDGPAAWARRIGDHGALTEGLAQWVADTAADPSPRSGADLRAFARELRARNPELATELGERVLKEAGGPEEVQVAAVAIDPRTGKPMIPGPKIPWMLEGGGSGGGAPRGTMSPGQALKAVLHLLFGIGVGAATGEATKRGDDATRVADGNKRMDSSGSHDQSPQDAAAQRAERSMIKSPPPMIPGFPAKPPLDPKEFNKTEKPLEIRRPTLLVRPIDGSKMPTIEFYPDMSDELEQWLVLHSRGTKDGQQKDVQYTINRLHEKFKERGIKRKHVGGGYDPETNEYVKERFIHGPKGGKQNSRRSDFAFGDDSEVLDGQLQDTKSDRKTADTRESNAKTAIEFLKTLKGRTPGDTIGLPKSKGWQEDEWKSYMDAKLDAYLDAKYGKKEPK